MLRYLHHKLKQAVLITSNKIIIVIASFVLAFMIDGCGRAYFPIELKTVSRAERAESQEKKGNQSTN